MSLPTKLEYYLVPDLTAPLADWLKARSLPRFPMQAALGQLQKTVVVAAKTARPEAKILAMRPPAAAYAAMRDGAALLSLDQLRGEAALLAFSLNTQRAVNPERKSVGLQPRPNQAPLDSQFNALGKQLAGRDCILYDDVVFDGDTMCATATRLKQFGIRVTSVFAGLATAQGVVRLQAELGVPVLANRLVQDSSCFDIISLKDFVVGAPNGGRSCYEGDAYAGSMPYLQPWGDPVKWASIPAERSAAFSASCIQASAVFWQTVEKAAARPLLNDDLPQPLYGVGRQEPIVQTLNQMRLL